jgi:hypothetical protein
MATTTNYSWTTPDDTDLVKDGAAAIRTLGSSVDTTVKNLNPETTLGDIAYRSSTANVKTRLALGTAGQVLAVNSGATAPEWKTFVVGGMTSIATGTLSGTTTTISSIPGTYVHLYLVVKGPYLNVADLLKFIVNGITSSTYNTSRIGLGGTTLTGTSAGNGYRIANTNTPTTVNDTMHDITFFNYSTTSFKNVAGNFGRNGGGQAGFGNNSAETAAITSIGITTDAGTSTFSGGTYTLYGVS